MKTTILLLSLILLPLMKAEGRTPTVLPGAKPTGTVRPFKPAVKPTGPGQVKLMDFPGCTGPCIAGLEAIFTKHQIQVLNRIDKTGERAEIVSQIAQALPAVNAKLQNMGMPTGQSKTTVNAILSATNQSSGWNDPVATKNLIQYANQLATDPREYIDKIDEVNNNCQPIQL